jgi:cytochrome o ubiquinol oxidase subunit IV
MTAVLARAYPASLKDPVSADPLERLPAIGLKDDALARPPPTSVHSTVEAVALILPATSSWVANTSLLWPGGLGLAVLAIAQMGIHLVFFLHITGGPDSINNILAVAFGLLIVFVVVAGSMWIMADLNDNMLMPSADLMDRAIATRVFRSELVSRQFLA